jgi:hypothetical protein
MNWHKKIFLVIFTMICCVNLEAKSFAQRIVLDSSGAGVAVWNTSYGTYNGVDAAMISATGVWSPSQMLSDTGEDCSPPIITTDSVGNTIVMWSCEDTTLGVRVLEVAMLPAGGSWSSPIMISSPSEDVAMFGDGLTDPAYRLIMNDSGAIVALWNSYIASDLDVRSASYINGKWSAPQTVSK